MQKGHAIMNYPCCLGKGFKENGEAFEEANV
jgi:hypothetical protein